MLLNEKLKDYNLILASGSPRRQQFFKDLKLDFKVCIIPIEEIYPESLLKHEITDYLAQLKTTPFKNNLQPADILVTSDTIVWHENKALGKPINYNDAYNMLQSLSNQMHEVITSVCFTTIEQQRLINHTTKVYFKSLTKNEIEFYLNTFKPFDKAGAYGIQDWIGQIGIQKIEGSYSNVVGLPLYEVYNTLNALIE